MYNCDIFSNMPEATPVPYGDSVNFQMYRAWDGSYFAVPANTTANNAAPLDQSPVMMSPVSSINTNSPNESKRTDSKPLQNVINPLFPNNQFVPLLPNTPVSCVPTPSLSQDTASSPSMSHFCQPVYGLNPAPNLDNPPTPLSPQYSSRLSPINSSIPVPLPLTPADQRTIFTSPPGSSPATETRYNDPFPVIDLQLPFDTLLNNLQELLSLDQYAKNSSRSTEQMPTHSKSMELSNTQSNETHILPASQYIPPKPSPSMQHIPRLHSNILPNLSTDGSPHFVNQVTVTAREHSLKKQLSQLAKRNPAKVNELSYFLQSQSAQIELHRLQQLTEASYPHYKEWLNNECDSQLHQLMDRVEVSLQVLEKCGKKNQTEKPRRKIADGIAKVLEEWYQANAHHPYPTAEMCQILASRTGLHVQQIRKWFSNKRCRLNVIQKRNEKKWIKQTPKK